LLKFSLAQDVEKKKAEQKTPHFLGLNQDIVVWSPEEKCGLKYVIHTPGGPVWTSVEKTYTEQWNYAGMVRISKELTHGQD